MKSEFSFFRGNFSIVAVDFFFLKRIDHQLKKNIVCLKLLGKLLFWLLLKVDPRLVSGLWCVMRMRCLFGSSLLSDERLVDVRNDTTASNCGFDQAVEFLVSTNSELKMARCDTLDFQIL